MYFRFNNSNDDAENEKKMKKNTNGNSTLNSMSSDNSLHLNYMESHSYPQLNWFNENEIILEANIKDILGLSRNAMH